MNMIDVFTNAFLEGYASKTLTVRSVVVCMIVTALISMYVFFVYRLVNRKSFYNRNFNAALPAIAIVTAAIILTIQASIVVSLGMVGALSIVRFRTAIKEPLDLLFLFWSISIGIICGAGFAMIAVIASLFVTGLILLIERLPIAKAPRILLVNATDPDTEADILSVVKKYCSLYKVRARNLSAGHIDMALEVRTKEESTLVKELMKVNNVTSASLVAHDGEVTFS